MNTYTLLSGEIVKYPDQSPAVTAFLKRVEAAVNDPAIAPAEVLTLVYGIENPILDTSVWPGRAMVTKAVFENPVYHIFSDMVGRKEMLASGQTPEQLAAPYTLTVKDAAEQLGLTESSVRTAIQKQKLSAIKRNGDWYIHPYSVDSYKVSNRGRKKARTLLVNVCCGSAKGGSLSVRIAGAELAIISKEGNTITGRFPSGWTRAAVRTTSPKGTRVFEIEPSQSMEKIEFNGLSVTGPFQVMKKHNATAAAAAAWKKYASDAVASSS